MKPTDCGYQAYSSDLSSLFANSSAILFSNPSACWLENGRLCGSAHTRSTLGSTSSIDSDGSGAACAAASPSGTPAAQQMTASQRPQRFTDIVFTPVDSDDVRRVNSFPGRGRLLPPCRMLPA